MGAIWGTFVGFMEQALLWLSIWTGSTGLGIIIFTICARLLILPLTLKSIRSSRKMQELQPKIKELQRKHGKDQKKLQEETIKLYQEYQINPLGGCLPMLLQLPIFIGVYWAVLHLMDPAYSEQLSPTVQSTIANNSDVQAILARPFLGILDLGMKPFEDTKFDLEHFNGFLYLVLPILSIVLQFTQQLMAMPRVQDPQQKAMSRAMLFMPLFFAYITLIFPAGAVLYWVTSSIVGIIQQYFTSGWGSLANHLKFLPPDKKSKEQQQPAAVTETTETVETAGSAPAVAASRPTGFWDVLNPLTESVVEEGGSTTVATDMRQERTSDQEQRQRPKQTSSRRSRRRR
jgi:YidC/Oxa1 family membrane protein insertase